MANKVVIFPVGQQVAAAAYQTSCNAAIKVITGNPNAMYAYLRNDAFDQWVVPYLGPPFAWNSIVVPEPSGGEAARAAGVLHDYAIWPEEDE